MNLQATNLECFRANRLLFSELNFILRPSEMLYITGPNGSGKTTLLRILAGLLLPTAGEVRWCGKSIIKHNAIYQNNIAYLGHKLGVKLGLTILENLNGINNLRDNTKKNELQHVLRKFDLYDYQYELAQKLSAGQLQRIALIRLLAADSKLWILDEPFAVLDTAIIEKFQQEMIKHRDNGGMIIITSHQSLPLENMQRLQLPILQGAML